MMDFLMDFLVEVIFNVFAEGFVALAGVFMPNKALSPRTEKILAIIFSLIGLCLFVLLVVGIIILNESRGDNPIGWIFMGVSTIYVALSIVARIVIKIKK